MKLQEIFAEVNSKFNKFFQPSKLNKFFQRPSFVESAVKNFVAGVNAIAQKTQEDEQYWEEGGIRIQENSPKSGGREETQTKETNRTKGRRLRRTTCNCSL